MKISNETLMWTAIIIWLLIGIVAAYGLFFGKAPATALPSGNQAEANQPG